MIWNLKILINYYQMCNTMSNVNSVRYITLKFLNLNESRLQRFTLTPTVGCYASKRVWLPVHCSGECEDTDRDALIRK